MIVPAKPARAPMLTAILRAIFSAQTSLIAEGTIAALSAVSTMANGAAVALVSKRNDDI